VKYIAATFPASASRQNPADKMNISGVRRADLPRQYGDLQWSIHYGRRRAHFRHNLTTQSLDNKGSGVGE
jgi:hypothetical protein